MRFYHDNAEIRHGADTRELNIDYQDKIIVGKFIDEDKPTFNELMDKHYGEILGERYVPMPPEGGMIHAD